MEKDLKILLLEDNPADAELIKVLLKRAGIIFEAVCASDRKEFTDALNASTFDVILADHSLPQFTSVEALDMVREKKMDTCFILVTGTVSEEFAVSIIQKGADDYLLKSNLNRLPSAIKQALEKRQQQRAKESEEKQLKFSQEELRELFIYSQRIREEERARIAREIHDELGQQLTGIKMDIFWLSKRLPTVEDAVKEKIKTMIELIDTTVKSVRKISSDLRPGILDDLGLIAALDWQTNEFQKRTEIKCSFHSEVGEQPIEKNLATGIFRIFQETLTNVARHAHASEIKSTIERENGQIVLTIRDNGSGFDEKEMAKKKTLGIVGMGERAKMMGGVLKINSAPGQGTTMVLKVPVTLETSN